MNVMMLPTKYSELHNDAEAIYMRIKHPDLCPAFRLMRIKQPTKMKMTSRITKEEGLMSNFIIYKK